MENEPDVVGDDGTSIKYHIARILWENGEFGKWACGRFPLTICGKKYRYWRGVEDALSDDTWDEEIAK
jgi:hypothetical protein